MNIAKGLKVSYRKGRPFAAYLYLPHERASGMVESRRFEKGIVADIAANGKCIGLELTAPSSIDVNTVNRILNELGGEPINAEDLRPLLTSPAA